MRKVLLGTTALVAAGLIGSGPALAEDLSFGVRGYLHNAYGYVSEDDDNGDAGDNHRDHALNTDAEIHFRGEATLDNGLTVGGRVELEAFTSGDQIDERWGYLRGGFGELRFGDEDDARKLKSYAAPTPTPNSFGVNSPFFTFNNLGAGHVATTVSTFRSLANDAAKVIYFTPSFGGFQLAGSYAPDGTQDRTGFGTGTTGVPGAGGALGDCGQISNEWSVGADYSGEFSGFTVGLGGGYSQGSRESSASCEALVGGDIGADPTLWAVGLNLGFAGFTVGGSVAFVDNDIDGVDEGDVEDSTVYDVGVTYTLDAVTVGLGWSHGEYNTGDGDDTLDHIQIGAAYALGPGVTLAAMVGTFEYDDDGPTGNDNEGWQAAVGTGFNF
jgi:outer membrane protein OmpU